MMERCNMFKYCKRCDSNLALEYFSKNKNSKDGKVNFCKPCVNMEYKVNNKKFAEKTYRQQVKNSLKRGHKPPKYSKSDFTDWLLNQDKFYTLHKIWKDSGYDINKVPSCDRIDDYKGYSFDNIRLVSWEENNAKAKIDMKGGINNKNSKEVVCYTLDGTFFARYPSAEFAARVVKGSSKNIRYMCNKKPMKKGYDKNGVPRYSIPKKAYGYMWEWFKEGED